MTGLKQSAKDAADAGKKGEQEKARQHLASAALYAGRIEAEKEALKEAFMQDAVDKMKPEKEAEEEATEDPETRARAKGESDFNSRIQPAFDDFEAEAQIKSAQEWIEDAQESFNDPEEDRDKQIARIIAARHLSKGRDLGTQITAAQLDRYAENLLQNIEFESFLDSFASDFDPKDVSSKNGEKVEKKLDAWAKSLPEVDYHELANNKYLKRYRFKTKEEHRAHLETLPRMRSAAQIIEGIQKKHRYHRSSPTENELASILAARQLGNAKRGSRRNLDKNLLEPDQVENRAQVLRTDPTFQEFISHLKRQAYDAALQKLRDDYPETDDTVLEKHVPKDLPLIDPRKLTGGHGGQVEDAFEEFLKDHLKKEENRRDLDPAIYGRYLKKLGYAVPGVEKQAPAPAPAVESAPKYTGYEDYFEKNKDAGKVDLEQASKMAAADHLRRKNPEGPFDEKLLNETAQQFREDPSFRLVTRDRDVTFHLCHGNADLFARRVKQLEDDFAASIRGTDDPEEAEEFVLPQGFSNTADKLLKPDRAKIEKTAEAELPKQFKKLREEFDAKIESQARRYAAQKAAAEYKKRFHTLEGFAEDLEVTVKIDAYAKEEKERLLAEEQKKFDDRIEEIAALQAREAVRKK